jgi:septal ring factor EnvC (AmiA/AmiB activator)
MPTNFRLFARIVIMGSLLTWAGLSCTTKPNQEETGKLEQAKTAAESAEKKLSELRQERIQLENDVQSKETDLKSSEKERDDLQNDGQ